MSFGKFLSDKVFSVILITAVIAAIEIFMLIYPVDWFIRIYIPISILSAYFLGLFAEYLKRKKYYEEIKGVIDQLTDKYLFLEIAENAEFFDAKQLKEILYQTNKAMIENVNHYKISQKEYKEYIELWIHDIKIPIAAGKMIVENNKNSVTQSIYEELDKIEEYTEQALYYARSSTIEKDYLIKKCTLKDMVTESIKRNKNYLIRSKFQIKLDGLDYSVKTDSKWVVFILNQIIQNSIKYSGEEPKLEFYGKCGEEQVTLYICDNGIGIDSGEIDRVFEKGFTGSNGRLLNKKSTGLGLYLCKKLCVKLHIGIEISSEKGKGTKIKLIFPLGSFTDLK